MSKQYGLIIPGQQKKPTVSAPTREIPKPSIFDESSDESDDDGPPQLKMKATVMQGPGVMERRMARRVQEKALEEDPTVYQYDELYDEMDNKREVEKQSKSNEPKKPKYIGRLMEFSERRKLENELRVERQVQKEREEEGEEFKDKESFVTSAYRKKLEEMRQLEEREKRDEYLEAIGDVTKQKDLDGFYRHLYEQKMGTTKEVQKPTLPNTSAGDEEIAYKPIKSGKPPQQRAYRKRHSSDDDEDADQATTAAAADAKKVHLQNNIDADSDFSIDSSGEEDDESDTDAPKDSKDKQPDEKNSKALTTNIALNLDAVKKEKEDEAGKTEKEEGKEKLTSPAKVPKPKKDKSQVWKKRTVGAVFDAAVARYFERKAARCA